MKEVVHAAAPAVSFTATIRLDVLPSTCLFAQVGQVVYFTLPDRQAKPITFDTRVVGLIIAGQKPILYPGHVRAYEKVLHVLIEAMDLSEVIQLSKGEFYSRFCRAY